MQIIADCTTVLEYEPFQGALDRWFKLREQGEFSDEAYLALSDPLQDYRIVASIKQNPLSITYDIVGATIEHLYGSPMAGKNLNELYDEWFRKRAYEGYQRSMQENCPIYSRRSFATIVHKIGYHKLHLPFGAPVVNQAVTYIMPMDVALKNRVEWEDIINRTPWFSGHR